MQLKLAVALVGIFVVAAVGIIAWSIGSAYGWLALGIGIGVIVLAGGLAWAVGVIVENLP